MKLILFTLLLLFNVNILIAQGLLEQINTEVNEYGIAFITDDLVCFTRSDGTKRLMLAQRTNGVWNEPTIASFSKGWDSKYPTFDRTTSRLYFGSTRPISDGGREQNSNDIWFVQYQDGAWSSPTHLGGVFSRKGIDSGAFGVGDQIYFHSDREGSGMNSVDIYTSSNGSENLTKLTISTNVVDGEVHLFNNGNSMLFMSAGHRAIGRSDIFFSKRVNDSWTSPVSVDTTGSVNTSAWEYSPSLSISGDTLYFTRITNGNADIYEISTMELSISF